MPTEDRPTSIDLFAGAGGLTLGFHQAGFRTLLGTDLDANAAETYRANFPDVSFIERGIEEVSAEEILKTAGIRKGELDVLLGGPPCQAFSVYNHQRGFHDERSGLFREYLRVVAGVLPRAVVIENVVGMTSLGNGRAVTEIHDQLKTLGYTVVDRVLEAEVFGVPQERRRIFFVGLREGEFVWPEATHGPHSDLLRQQLHPLVTVKEALSDLPPLGLGEGTDEPTPYGSDPEFPYQLSMRQRSEAVTCHIAPRLGDINVKRMKHIPQGGSWRDIPHELLPAGMKRAKRSDHTKRYGRLHPDGLASTILTKCDLHWGAYIHPEQDRSLTVREAARFQSFPDRFRFKGSRMEQYRQVGNAVPPLLAEAVARTVAEALDVDGSLPMSEAVAVGY